MATDAKKVIRDFILTVILLSMRLEHFKGGNTTCSDYDECANGIYYYSEHNTNQLNNNFDSWPPQVILSYVLELSKPGLSPIWP